MRNRQQFILLFFKPDFSLVILAFRAVPVFAGMVAVDKLAAGVVYAEVEMAAHTLGTAVFNIPHGPQMTGENSVCVFFPVLPAIAAEDVRQLRHQRLKIGHQAIDGLRGR